MFARPVQRLVAGATASSVPSIAAAAGPVGTAVPPAIAHSIGTDLPVSTGGGRTDAARPNRTGLPDGLKLGIEALSGVAMDDVRVHRNSPKPGAIMAHAFAQGSHIHLAPGQDRHLPHEAWHVVQQKQGRVRPTMQLKAGVPVNDDAALEREADAMGARAVSHRAEATAPLRETSPSRAALGLPVQRVVLHKIAEDGTIFYYSNLEKGKKSYATQAEAKAVDDNLAADPTVIDKALYADKKGTPKRTNTPYSYGLGNPASAAPNASDQGPHTVGFAAQEYRLQERLRKNQHAELANQILSPAEFEGLMDNERPKGWTGSDNRKRMLLDYHSLHAKWQTLNASGPHAIGSEFHLVTRQIMQMHPYTTYGQDVSSAPHKERKESRFGTRVIDKGAYVHGRTKNTEELERLYEKRQQLFHHSDAESDGEGFVPYQPRHLKPANVAEATAAASSSSSASAKPARSPSFGMLPAAHPGAIDDAAMEDVGEPEYPAPRKREAASASAHDAAAANIQMREEQEDPEDDMEMAGPSSTKRPAIGPDEGELAAMEEQDE